MKCQLAMQDTCILIQLFIFDYIVIALFLKNNTIYPLHEV